MRLTILGAGRLGRSMAVLLANAPGVRVQLCARGEQPDHPDVLWLTVSDRDVAAVARAQAPGPVVLHASGSLGLDVLEPHERVGSLHPLMTFPGPEQGLPTLTGVPAAVVGHRDAVAAAHTLCDALGLSPFAVPGDRRLYHCAAVMAGNYTTVLLAEAARVLEAAGIDPREAPSLLVPLARASLEAAASDPVGALTGPAARGDEAVLTAHQQALAEAGLEEQAALYRALLQRTRDLVSSRDGR